jgi:hypothetical protein
VGEGASYILLDPPARAALIEAEADGRHHTGALPLEVEGNEVELIRPAGRLRLPVTANTVYQVDGWGTARQWRLGEEVRTDVVEVAGAEPAVRNLASALGSRAPQPWNGRWRLEGPDALVRLSWMGDLAEITEVALVLTDEARARVRSELDSTAEALPAFARPARADEGLEALVGLYTSDRVLDAPGFTLFLDAEGGFLLEKECDPAPIRGTYRRSGGGIRLYGTDLALTILESGRLEAPGVVFSAGEER